MLTENLWTEQGLVNGTLGTIHDIAWKVGRNPSTDAPDHLLISFDGYTGPGFIGDGTQNPIVPIFKSIREFARGNKVCHRIQFPMTIAYSVTIHKAQGLTVDKAVLNISEKDFSPGLSYVAVSRVKTLRDVLFQFNSVYTQDPDLEALITALPLPDAITSDEEF
jgi:ATP-dependent DNA helicase PIF1